MGKLKSTLLLLILSSSAYAGVNSPSGALLLNPKAYSLNISEYAFGTTGYFDADKNETALSSDKSFTLSDTDFRINYGFFKNFEGGLLARVRRVASATVENSVAVNASKLGLESLGVNFKYKFNPIGNSHFAFGGSFRKTMYTNTKYDPSTTLPSNEIVLGDDGSEYTVDFYSSFLYTSGRIDATLSYVAPPNQLSSEINYDIMGSYYFNSFGLLAGFKGIHSMGKDAYTDSPASKPTMPIGSTTLFNSVNHEMYAAYGGALYDFNKKALLDVRGGMILGGKSYDKGLFALISVSYNTAGETAETEKIESFKEYHIEGSVLKVSPRGNFIKIDQGLSTDVEKGMYFDIYQTDYFGGNVLVATGVVYEIGSDWSVIRLVKKYANIEIKPGFAARGK